jgi:sigma-B regulation protein RsbU (phosphoserine phosphatase)
MMEKLKNLLPFLILLAVAFWVLLRTFPLAHPYGGIHLPLDANDIKDRSEQILSGLRGDLAGLQADVSLKANRDLIRQAQQTYGIEQSNKLLMDQIPGYYWEVNWNKPESIDLPLGSQRGEGASKEEEQIASLFKGEIFLQLDTQGRLLRLERRIPDSLMLPSLSMRDAEALARSFLRQSTAIGTLLSDTASLASEKQVEQPHRADFQFAWNTISPVLGDPVNVKVSVAGNLVSRFEAVATIPEQFTKRGDEQALGIVLGILYVILIIGMIVISFRRFRSYEIGFRLATVAGIATAVAFDLDVYLTMHGQGGWSMLLSLLLPPIFIGGAYVLVWAVSESAVREVWKEKFITLDLLGRGHIAHSRVGGSIIRGITLGVVSAAVWAVTALAAGRFAHLWIIGADEPALQSFGLFAPWLYVLAHGLSANAFPYAIVILFVVSLLRKRINSAVLLITVAAVVAGFATQVHLFPIVLGFVIQTLVAAVWVWTFHRYDALAALLSLYTYTVAQEAAGLLVVGNATYAGAAYLVLGLLAVLLIGSLATLVRKKEITDFEAITPAFARHITERQRLQQELEIARNVQMSFLPKSNPEMFELDIASRCAPALEVGGDYYDFIDLGEGRLGVAVGDVSGKGTQAAFFMTLTKGFLRALAKVSDSPSAVLTQVNKLFYESVERGVFISMVYGIFDTKQRTLTLARAGHNPVIMQKTQAAEVQVVNPSGLALGLDGGEAFSKSIQQMKLPFQNGDLFVFYTDGFPEAMNKTREEFGEERLCQTIQHYAHGSAAEVMEGVFADTRRFVGRAKQHDDMTIVVVKAV